MKQSWWERVETMTECEYELFLAVGSGLTNKDIARKPGRVRSLKAVESMMALCRRRVGAYSIAQMRAWAGQYWMARQKLGLVRTLVPKRWMIMARTDL